MERYFLIPVIKGLKVKGVKMGKYELLYIVHPDLESSIDKITDRVRSFIETRKGKVNYEENWGKRKLAYEIKKSEVGIYVLVYFEAPTEALAKIERDIRLTEEIIRYMLLATSDRIKKAEKKKEEKPAEPKIEEVVEEEKPKAKTTAKSKTDTKAPAKKAAVKKSEKEPKESEEERMKQLDEKLGAILGDEEEKEVKEKKVKSKKSEK